MQPARTPLPAGLHVWNWDYFTRILSRPYLHFYYRYMYGHTVPLARAFAKLARFMEERMPMGNIPLPKERMREPLLFARICGNIHPKVPSTQWSSARFCTTSMTSCK